MPTSGSSSLKSVSSQANGWNNEVKVPMLGEALRFLNDTVRVYPKQVQAPQQELRSFWKETVKRKPRTGAVAVLGDMAVKTTEECAISDYGAVKNFELPNCTKTAF